MRYRGSLPLSSYLGGAGGITLGFCAPVPLPPNAIPVVSLHNHVRGSNGGKMDLVPLLLLAQAEEGKCRRCERQISIWTKAMHCGSAIERKSLQGTSFVDS